MKIVFWKRKDIVLGDQAVSELTVLEWKRLFSLKLFHFHPTEGKQDRWHTHAFGAVSILIYGDYTEEILQDGKVLELKRSRKRFLFIPENQYHRITRSVGCRTLLITGPWGPEFSELRHIADDKWQEVVCGEHRVDRRDESIIQIEGCVK